jgi:hypothetical protein
MGVSGPDVCESPLNGKVEAKVVDPSQDNQRRRFMESACGEGMGAFKRIR